MFVKLLDKWINVNHIENIAVHPSKSDSVNRPAHYCRGGLEDLKKAAHYLR